MVAAYGPCPPEDLGSDSFNGIRQLYGTSIFLHSWTEHSYGTANHFIWELRLLRWKPTKVCPNELVSLLPVYRGSFLISPKWELPRFCQIFRCEVFLNPSRKTCSKVMQFPQWKSLMLRRQSEDYSFSVYLQNWGLRFQSFHRVIPKIPTNEGKWN